jgi:ATP-dependent RNA helicase DeaD
MAEGSVWFRAAIGRRKNAEARWLLPMICRRGGIDKQDIGAIRILDTTTEFEISERAAESFAAMIRRPDKEDNIRIEPLAGPPQIEARPERPVRGPKPQRATVGASGAGFDAGFDHDPSPRPVERHRDKPGFAAPPRSSGAPSAKPAFGKKPFGKKLKKKNRG